MTLIKTTAVVEDSEHLKLHKKLKSIEKGEEVELAIFLKKNASKLSWQETLKNIGTYTENDLSGIDEARRDLNTWHPTEFQSIHRLLSISSEKATNPKPHYIRSFRKKPNCIFQLSQYTSCSVGLREKN